jgi:hypothetical protein
MVTGELPEFAELARKCHETTGASKVSRLLELALPPLVEAYTAMA